MADKIFVTGGTGLIGSYLIHELVKQRKKVKAIYHNRQPLFDNPVERAGEAEWIRGDVLDTVQLGELLSDCSQVYHCAAYVSFHPKKRNAMYRANIAGTANIVDAGLECGIRKMVHVSSVSALGRLRYGERVNETHQWSEETNNSHYGITKHLSELEVWRGIGEGLNAVIVNPAIVLGVNDWNKGSSALFKSTYNHFPWYTKGVTGFVDVRDVITAMVRLMDSDISGERFIISAEDRSYQDVLTAMANAFGSRPPHRRITPWLGELVWRWEAIKSYLTGEEPLVTKETARTGQARVYFDNSKLLKFLPGFQYIPFEETIMAACKQYLQKNKMQETAF